jgi:hypothetical protein
MRSGIRRADSAEGHGGDGKCKDGFFHDVWLKWGGSAKQCPAGLLVNVISISL